MVSSSSGWGLVAASLAVLAPMSSVGDPGPAAASLRAGPPLVTDSASPTDHLAAEPLQLPAPAAVGQSAHTEAAIQTTVEGGPVSLRVITSSSVSTVFGDGSYVTNSVIDTVAVTNAPASADISAWGFGNLHGVSFDRGFAATGTPLSRGAQAADAQSLVLNSVAMASVGFPAEPVAVGDSWNVNGRIGSDGVVFRVSYQCRLASVADGAYTVDVSYAENFTIDVDGGLAEGTISGTGTISGSLANPLVVWGGINQTIDGVSTIDGTATPLRRDTSITLTSLGG